MGCTTSKQAQWDRQSKARASRSYSLPHHRISESYHAASLSSSTLGSLKLETIEALEQNLSKNEILDQAEEDSNNKKICNELAEFSVEVFRAKIWSNKIEEKIPRKPKTPNLTPPNEPEVINTWELMEGLEDNSPIRISTLDRSFSFHTYFDPETEIKPKGGSSSPILESASASPKPAWLQINSNDSVVTDFDPEVISTFRKALKDISPERVCSLRSPEREKQPTFPASPKDDLSNKIGFVKARVSDFQKKIDAKKGKVSQLHSKCPPQGEDRVVFYFTSLRGVRKTYEDCCNVRMILKGGGVRVDERDVSMHRGFREELNEVLEEGERRSLPKLFVKGRYLGGADEVRQLHEAGELEKILEGCELVEDGGSVCEACGNVRFINCERCFGSCKLYYEEEEDEDEDEDKDREEDEDGGGFQRCPDCNENGIIRCPVCCYYSFLSLARVQDSFCF